MTNISNHAYLKGNKITVLADGSKYHCSNYDKKQKFEIHRFDQLKFLRKKIKSNFANNQIDQANFDAVYFDSWKSLEGFNKNTNIKKICLVHGNDILNIKKKERIINSLSKSDKIIFNSIFTQKLFLKNFKNFPRKKLSIIYPAFVNIIKRSSSKKKYDLCSVARLEYRKGHHLVLEALAKINSTHDLKLSYAILGDGPELSHLKDLVLKYSLLNQVEFFDSQLNSKKIYDLSKIHIMPTITTPNSIEGFGISNIEAASQGLPCIVSNSGGTPESINGNGKIIKENNLSDLIDAILYVKKHYLSLSKKSLTFAKKFKSDLKIKEYLNCIQN